MFYSPRNFVPALTCVIAAVWSCNSCGVRSCKLCPSAWLRLECLVHCVVCVPVHAQFTDYASFPELPVNFNGDPHVIVPGAEALLGLETINEQRSSSALSDFNHLYQAFHSMGKLIARAEDPRHAHCCSRVCDCQILSCPSILRFRLIIINCMLPTLRPKPGQWVRVAVVV